MPSAALRKWERERAAELDQVELAHGAVGGQARGRRWATQQLNHAYAVLLAAQFQAFCRDLHSESVEALAAVAGHSWLQRILRIELTRDRKLDRGNPNPGNLGADFKRLGIDLWAELDRGSPRSARRRQLLQDLADWRNAIAHYDFPTGKLVPAPPLRLSATRAWRSSCNVLARELDRVVARSLGRLTSGPPPW